MYIIINDDIIQGVYDGAELPSNAVEVPNTFNGHKGENINLFTSNYTRKPLQQLVDEKIITIPDGQKIVNNQFVPMSQVEKINAELEELPSGYKIVDDELQEMSIQEKYDEKLIDENDDEYVNYRIGELQGYLSKTDWYAIRKADTGEEIPNDIKLERQNAREEISRLREV